MKIALVTDDGKTISAHFGRAAYYAVVEIADGRVVGREMREKPSHQGGHGGHGQRGPAEIGFQEQAELPPADTHGGMVDAIADCQIAVARGMGQGMHARLREAAIEPVLTEAREIDEAVERYLRGELVNRPERLH